MKKLLLTLLCISSIGAAFPAFAGPDWQLIEQARKAKRTELAQVAASKDQPAGMDHKMDGKMDPKMHENMDQMMKDCMKNMDMGNTEGKDHPTGMVHQMDPSMPEKMNHMTMMMDGMASKNQQATMGSKAEMQAWRGIYNGH